MPATFRAGSTEFNNGGTLTETAAKPTGTLEDDILIFLSHMHDSGSTVIVWPAGVTELDQVTNGSTTFTGGGAYKVAGDSEPADYTVENDNGQSGTDQFFGIAAVQGADTGAPIADYAVQLYAESEGTPNTAAPSVEGVAGGLLICAWLHQFDSSNIRTLTKPAEMTLGGTGQCSVSAGGYSIGTWAWEELSEDGPTGERIAVLADASPPVNADFVHVGVSIVIAPATATPPTADAGPDQTVAAGTEGVQLDGSASGGAGAPFTYEWEIISDTTGGAELSSTTAEDPTLDLGPDGGAVVLGLTVTDDDDVESAQDTVTINAIGAGAIAVPVADLSVSGWTGVPAGSPLYPKLADSTDATYAVYVDPEGDVAGTWDLSDWTPVPGQTAVLNVRLSQVGAGATVDVELREGASTVIASWADLAWTAQNIVQGYPLSLSASQVASITDPDNLRVIITGGVAE